MPLKDVLKKRKGRLARLGIIRLGYQVPNKSGKGTHPEAADHFVLTDAKELAEFYGDHPKELPIHFPYVDFDKNIEAYHRVWAGGICVCQGDGDIVHGSLPFTTKRDDKKRMHVYKAPGDRLVDSGIALEAFDWNGQHFKAGDAIPCPGAHSDLYPQCECCKPNIVLKVMIRDVRCARFGYYQIGTRSMRNYLHFDKVMDTITEGGSVEVPMNAVPFILRIAPAGSLYQDEKKWWRTTEKFFLQLEVAPDTMRKIEAGRTRRLEMLLAGNTDEPLRLDAPTSQIIDPEPEPESEEPTTTPPLSPQEGPIEDGDYEEVATEPEGTHRSKVIDGQAKPVPSNGWDDLPVPENWTDLYSRVGQLDYEHRNHAASIVKQLGATSPADAWAELIAHQKSKLVDKEGDYLLHPAAPAEAAAIVHQALLDAGQQELFPPDPNLDGAQVENSSPPYFEEEEIPF